METQRQILDEDQMRNWFKEFGSVNGKGFEEIFGSDENSKFDMNSDDEKFTFTIEDGIMFVKMKLVWYDVFGSTSQYNPVIRYMIIPQIKNY